MNTPHDAQSSHPSSSEVEAALAMSREALRKWLRRCEAGLELPLISEQALTEAMFTQGPHYLDAVVTYEHLALPLLERIDSNALALKRMALLYPRPTLVARHPAVIFQSDPEQKAHQDQAARIRARQKTLRPPPHSAIFDKQNTA